MGEITVLAVDSGNSRIKWGLAEDGAWREAGWAEQGRFEALGEAWDRLPRPQRIAAANVAGAGARIALERLFGRWGAEVEFLLPCAARCGVTSGYRDPAQLGPDRWAALIGGWQRMRRRCLVVVAGTAITVDTLDDDGRFRGGTILPGPGLMRRALARDTAVLDETPGQWREFPQCTADAIATGTLDAAAGAVEHMARRMGDAPCLLSGGWAEALAPRLNMSVSRVDNLVLEGLLVVARSASESP